MKVLCFFLVSVFVMSAFGELKVISREEWGAKPIDEKHPLYSCYNYMNHTETLNINSSSSDDEIYSMIYSGGRIVIHHTASKSASVKGVQSGHQKTNKWMDIGYHFFIKKNGEIYQGRELKVMGRHAGLPSKHGKACNKRRPFNVNEDFDFRAIGIVLEGNYENEKTVAEKQLAALEGLVYSLIERYGLKHIQGHSHYREGGTKCPGKHLLKEVKRMFADRLDPIKAIPQSKALNTFRPEIECSKKCKK